MLRHLDAIKNACQQRKAGPIFFPAVLIAGEASAVATELLKRTANVAADRMTGRRASAKQAQMGLIEKVQLPVELTPTSRSYSVADKLAEDWRAHILSQLPDSGELEVEVRAFVRREAFPCSCTPSTHTPECRCMCSRCERLRFKHCTDGDKDKGCSPFCTCKCKGHVAGHLAAFEGSAIEARKVAPAKNTRTSADDEQRPDHDEQRSTRNLFFLAKSSRDAWLARNAQRTCANEGCDKPRHRIHDRCSNNCYLARQEALGLEPRRCPALVAGKPGEEAKVCNTPVPEGVGRTCERCRIARSRARKKAASVSALLGDQGEQREK